MAVKRQTLNIPEQALQVLKMLERAGNKAYFVGQCVAELLRGGSPMDYDIITTADFSEMLYVFRDMRIVSQNEDMSSVMVSSLGLVIQVSSYCGEIKDGKAVYTDNYIFDLVHRDFSAFAIAYHPRKGFRDPFDGMPCIKDGVITLKAIGEYPVVMWHENDLDENELTLKLEPKSSLVTNPFNMLTALELLGAVIQVSSYCGEIKDGKAVYTDNYIFDLVHRDFSAFAIAYHPRKGFRDPFDGMPCIKDGVITLKAIGEYPVVMWHENDLDENELTLKLEPKSSLVTNPFNMLTALELLGAENYEIDSVTADAIKADAPLLREADKHELSRRFTRILLTRNISGVMARFPEVFSAIEPELLKAQRYKERYYDSTLWEHISKSVEFAPPQADIRYAMLFHNVGIPDCKCRDSHGNTFFYGHGEYGRITAANFFEKYMAELKLRSDTDMLIESHDISITEDRTAVKRLLCEYSHEELKKLIKLRIADDTAKPTVHEGVIAMYRRTLTMLDDIIASGECYSISQLAIKENDLITHRLVANKAQARAVIESLYEAVLDEPSLNVAPILLDMVRKSVRR